MVEHLSDEVRKKKSRVWFHNSVKERIRVGIRSEDSCSKSRKINDGVIANLRLCRVGVDEPSDMTDHERKR